MEEAGKRIVLQDIYKWCDGLLSNDLPHALQGRGVVVVSLCFDVFLSDSLSPSLSLSPDMSTQSSTVGEREAERMVVTERERQRERGRGRSGVCEIWEWCCVNDGG